MQTLPDRSRSRFVTACQQVLVLAVVLAGLTPALGVVSLDVVRSPHGAAGQIRTVSADVATVPTAPVRAEVREVSLTDQRGRVVTRTARTVAGLPADGRPGLRTQRTGRTRLVSPPAGVRGAGVVGVTWAPGAALEESEVAVQVRTRHRGAWTGWTDLVYHADEHGPDPESPEGRRARPGSDEAIVAGSDLVQARITTAKGVEVPADLRLVVVEAGAAGRSVRERAELDTATMPTTEDPAAPVAQRGTTDRGTAPAVHDHSRDHAEESDAEESHAPDGALALAASAYTAKPQIFSRAQWGADESLRDGSPSYGRVHAAFAHHTVTANEYSRDQVPGIIRSIYAYHTRSRGWSDIGYNFLVDKFGRIWEGRYGGVDRAVVGAHTSGYNSGAFAASALGNYEVVRPSAAMIQAYGRLFGWKLALHGVSPGSSQWVSGRAFGAVSGHRDAGSTACPGRYLYAELPRIRSIAASAQAPWTGRDLKTDLAGSPAPDLVARRSSDGKGVLIPIGGTQPGPERTVPGYDRRKVGVMVKGITLVLLSPSLDGDSIPDLVVGNPQMVSIRKGRADGTFANARRTTDSLLKHHRFAAVGDLNGDGHNDLVAQRTDDAKVTHVFLGNGAGSFRTTRLYRPAFAFYTKLAGPGDVTGDGKADLLGRDKAGRLFLHPGLGNGGFGEKVKVGEGFGRYNAILGIGDHTGDRRNDVFLRRDGGDGFVLPGLGGGRFGAPEGPIGGVAGVEALSSGGHVAGTRSPDMVGRIGTDLILLTSTTKTTRTPVAEQRMVTTMDLRGMAEVLNVGDWDRDGFNDVIARGTGGVLWLFRGTGTRQFHPRVAIGRGFHLMSKLAAVGDLTGDGRPDLMAQKSGEMRVFAGKGRAWLGAGFVVGPAVAGDRQLGVGRWNGDGTPDTLVRNGNRLVFYPSNGPGEMLGGTPLALDLAPYDVVVAVSDVGRAAGGQSDLVVRERGTGKYWLLPGSGVGVGARQQLPGSLSAYDLFG